MAGRPPMDLTGYRVNRLTVLRRAENAKSGHTRWVCQCECGNETTIPTSRIHPDGTRSCGCYHRESARTRAKAVRRHKVIPREIR